MKIIAIVKKSAQDTRSKRKSIAKCQEKFTSIIRIFIFYGIQMIRRIIWLLIVLGLTYGIYRAIDPIGAQELVARIQSYFDKEENKEEIVEQETEEIIDVEEEPREEVALAPVHTWKIQTGSLVELDYVLSESATIKEPEQSNIVTTWTTSSSSTTTSTTTPTTTPKKASTTHQKSLSKQDEADMKAFLNAIVE